MQGDATQRWYGCFRSEGAVQLDDATFKRLRRLKRWSYASLLPFLVALWFSCAFAFTDGGDGFLQMGGTLFVATLLVACILLPFAWRCVAAVDHLELGKPVERFVGVSALHDQDRTTRVLRRAGRVSDGEPATLLVLAHSGHLLSVNGRVRPLIIRAPVSVTAAMTELEPRELNAIERTELESELAHRRVFNLGAVAFVAGLVAATTFVALQGYDKTTTVAPLTSAVVFAALFAALHFPLAATNRRDERAIRRDMVQPLRVDGDSLVLAETGLVWQRGDQPGGIRLNHGGLLSRRARHAWQTPTRF